MKDLSDITACVIDHGIFFGLAQQLSKTYKKVYYHFPGWERGFSSIRDGVIGDGMKPEVEILHDIWPKKKEIDLFVFPDIQHAGLQLELESQGFRVWGSRTGDSLETMRLKFIRTVESLGLDVAPCKVIGGMTDLREYLKANDDKYIKISRWRADLETHHHINYQLSRNWLDQIALKLGDLQDEIQFLVFDPIDTDVEVGYDGFSIDGWYPNTAVHGIEKKDQAYIGAVQNYDDLPEQVRKVNEAFSDVLGGHHYRNFWSTEIRIVGDKFYFIDPTCRAGMPSGDGQFVLYKNLGEIIWEGAAGNVVEPEFAAKYVVQALIEHHDDPDHWRSIQIPEHLHDHVRLLSPCKVGDTYAISPSSAAGETVGSILSWNDDLEKAVDEVVAMSKELEKDNPIHIHIHALMDVLSEMQSAADQGVEMTTDPIPEPAILLDK